MCERSLVLCVGGCSVCVREREGDEGIQDEKMDGSRIFVVVYA